MLEQMIEEMCEREMTFEEKVNGSKERLTKLKNDTSMSVETRLAYLRREIAVGRVAVIEGREAVEKKQRDIETSIEFLSYLEGLEAELRS